MSATTASEKTLMVLEAAMRHGRFSDVVSAVDLPKATVHRILATLGERGFVTVAEGGTYVPGPKILALAGIAYARVDVASIVQPYVDDLVRRVQCTVHVGVRNGDEIIYLVRTDSDKPYRMPSRVGAAIPLHTSAIGKSILAQLDDDAIARLVNRAGLPRRTARTLTSLDALQAELEQVRHDGYAFDREENVPGVICIGTSIRDHTGHVNYGLSISTLALEHTEEQLAAMSADLLKSATDITHALGGDERTTPRAVRPPTDGETTP